MATVRFRSGNFLLPRDGTHRPIQTYASIPAQSDNNIAHDKHTDLHLHRE